MTPFARAFSKIKRHWFTAILFFVPLILSLFARLPDLYKHILLTLTAVMGIHILDRLYLVRDMQDTLDTLREDVCQEIVNASTFESKQAMIDAGIVRIYQSRNDAANDIVSDLINLRNAKVRLIGISLIDFANNNDPKMAELRRILNGLATGTIHAEQEQLNIQVLLIDPRCLGAKLRAEAETRDDDKMYVSRLATDVKTTARYLKRLENRAKKAGKGVTIECRLYRLAPIAFLCLVDEVCYVQQYHFWTSQDDQISIPILKYKKELLAGKGHSYYEEMEQHFNWIWGNVAIPVDEYLNNHTIGSDEAIYKCGVVNIYADQKESGDRIKYLLMQATEAVWIQGISLRSFFDKEGVLSDAMYNALAENKAEIRVLLLDPTSEQAMYRSYREWLLDTHINKISFEEYCHQKHTEAKLCRDTKDTIESIKQMVLRIKTEQQSEWNPKISIRLYHSAPMCLVLRVDHQVLVEQFHYGKVGQGESRILDQMPVMEYCSRPSNIYQEERKGIPQPYALMLNHLERVFELATPVDLDL